MKRLIVVCSCMLLCCSAAMADTHYVDINNTTPSAPYTSWATAANDIQSAVDASVNGDTVLVNDGHYVLTSGIEVSKSVSIQSLNGPEHSIVDGNDTVGCISLLAHPSLIEGFTITKGNRFKGGGILSSGESDQVISNCVIIGNSSSGYGGGVFGGHLYNCIVEDNFAESLGGGLCNGYAYNCLVVSNSTSGTGGGMQDARLYNCTLSLNTANRGGGVDSCNLYNSILWFNIANETNYNNSRNCDFYYSSTPDALHGIDGNITNAPMFVGRLGGNYRLLPSSPCINAGSNAYVTASHDLDSKPRIQAGIVDMGAYEGIFNFNITKCSSAGSNIIIAWEATVGMNSIVKYTPDLTTPFTPISTALPYPANSYTDTVHGAESECFYRVEMVP